LHTHLPLPPRVSGAKAVCFWGTAKPVPGMAKKKAMNRKPGSVATKVADRHLSGKTVAGLFRAAYPRLTGGPPARPEQTDRRAAWLCS